MAEVESTDLISRIGSVFWEGSCWLTWRLCHPPLVFLYPYHQLVGVGGDLPSLHTCHMPPTHGCCSFEKLSIQKKSEGENHPLLPFIWKLAGQSDKSLEPLILVMVLVMVMVMNMMVMVCTPGKWRLHVSSVEQAQAVEEEGS